ncbi:MAG TPA: molybdopterin cofactor-binding domain-containing protein [Pirellulales bacterium]|jgi:xanthine dehydrogenase large subunit|nr:molybdopterin cofactor-binding domain-containing protein [Pirellulales bacterium]
MPHVGKPIPHDSAVGHVTGAAPYIDDMPARVDELHVGFVGSPVASGLIESIDLSAARALPGVAALFTADDLPGKNIFGAIICDEPVLPKDRVLYVGQPVVVVAAESRAVLEKARRLVKINVTASEPILSIELAVELKRFIGPARRIAWGDVDAAMKTAPHRLSGVFHNLGQEQFYLESQAALAYPGEQGEMVVYSSTQNPTETQHVVAEALGLHMHQVVCICKRMGGGFGGKETQGSIPAVMAALVAQKTGRSARVIYNKDDDMCSTGKRHAYRAEWEVGFDDDGRILAYRVQYYSDGGAAADLSTSVMERTMLHTDNSYYFPNIEIRGQVCFTNYPPNTAFRGFGGPQGIAATENMIHEVAGYLKSRASGLNSAAHNGEAPHDGQANGKIHHDGQIILAGATAGLPSSGRSINSLHVQVQNLYGTEDRNITPYGQLFKKNHLPEILAQLANTSEYQRRLKEIEATNQTDRLWLRGLALSPVKFGISFTTKFLNQGNALVNVYHDGTVQVSTGGTEMGQGLYVKVRQLVADEFGLPLERVVVMATSTEKNINTSPTAASAGTDLNGAAAVNACRQIKSRMAMFAARQLASTELGLSESSNSIAFEDGQVFDVRHPQRRIPFGEFCRMARRERVDLGARGFYATPGVDFNRETGCGNPFFYFTQGAAVAEVKIDRFTGELTVPRVDMLMDIGRSINPGVDMGQIIGGFIQGMGWVTGECLVYNERGELLSHSPTTYKIPAVTDVPPVFNCDLFPNDDNTENVASSKAVGEPPLMHATCVWTAVKHALGCVSQAVASELRLPATGEEILRCLTLVQPRRPASTKTANGSFTTETQRRGEEMAANQRK